MGEMTLDQQKAMALMKMRKRAAEESGTGLGDYAMDIGRSALSGLRTGAEGVAGLIGDANQLQGRTAGWIAGQLGAGPETQDTVRNVASRLSFNPSMPTSEQIRSGTSKVIGEPYKPKTIPGEYARTIGEFAPGMAIPGGELGMAGRLATQTIAPALMSETAGQLTKGTPYEPYARVGGALMSPIVTAGARKLISPNRIGPERQAMVNTLNREGVRTTAGQQTGSQPLRYAESEIGGRKAAQIYETQGEQFTAAALRRAGINANRATPEVIDNGFRTIGKQFDDLASRNTMRPDRKFANDIMDTVNEYRQNVPQSARAPVVEDLARDIVQKSRSGIGGESYQSISSRLARLARGARNDPEKQQALYGLREALDDAMGRSIAATNPGDGGAWQQVRNQYRNMLVIERAATGAGENAAMGIISPSQLRNATVNLHGRRNYARGTGDFAELARSGEALMKPLPQSGTAPRMAAQLANFGTRSGAGGLIGGMIGGPVGATAGAAIGAGLPLAKGAAMMSRPGQAYLTNQILNKRMADPRTMAVVDALIAAQSQRALPSY